MRPPRTFLRLLLTLLIAVGIGSAFFFAHIVVHAQILQPLDPNFVRGPADANPDPGLAQSLIDDPTIGPDARRGNCCHPYYHNPDTGEELFGSYNPDTNRMECTWNVGVGETVPKKQVAACKALQYDSQLGVGEGTFGIHYNYSNWNLCNIQCEDLAHVVYCDAEQYQCVDDKSKLPGSLEDPAYRDKVKSYLTMDGCQRACKPPADLTTSVGCECNSDTKTNTCIVTVEQDPTSGLQFDVSVDSLKVELHWNAGDGVPVGSLADANGGEHPTGYVEDPAHALDADAPAPIAYQGRFLDVGDTFTEIEFAPTSSDVDYPLVIPQGERFTAEITVGAVGDPQANPTEGSLSVFVKPQSDDPDMSDNTASADLSSLKDCRQFTLNPECVYTTPEDTHPNQTFLWHTYTLGLGDYDQANDVGIDFALDSCMDADDDASVQLPAGCERNVSMIHCDFKSSDAGGIPDTVSFEILARPNDYEPAGEVDDNNDPRVCRIGEAIEVTATVTADNHEPDILTVNEPKKPCGMCDLCDAAIDSKGDPSSSMCHQAPYSEFCVWVTKGDTGKCVPNEDKCPIFYGCCKYVPASVDPVGGESTIPYFSYLYGGRGEDNVHISNTDGTDADSDELMFNDTQACYNEGIDRKQHPEHYVNDDGSPIPTDVIFYQKDTEDFHDSIKDGVNKYDYWKNDCEENTTTSSPPSHGGKSSASSVALPDDYYCSDIFDEADYQLMTHLVNEGLIDAPEPDDCEIYDDTQDIETGTVYFSDAYTPAGDPKKDTPTDFLPKIANFNGLNATGLVPVPDEYDKLSCPAVCDESKKIITCCMPDGCQVAVLREDCVGMQMPVGPNTSAECTADFDAGRCGVVPVDFVGGPPAEGLGPPIELPPGGPVGGPAGPGGPAGGPGGG